MEAARVCRTAIETACDDMLNIVRERRETLLEAITSYEQETLGKLETKKEVLADSLEVLRRSQTECEQILGGMMDLTRLMYRKEQIIGVVKPAVQAGSRALESVASIVPDVRVDKDGIEKIKLVCPRHQFILLGDLQLFMQALANWDVVIRPDIPPSPVLLEIDPSASYVKITLVPGLSDDRGPVQHENQPGESIQTAWFKVSKYEIQWWLAASGLLVFC